MTVSVALCTFDGVPFLAAQLESIAAQTVLPDELIIADDGSRDGTLDAVGAFADSAPFPVRVLEPSCSPRGVTGNFERAIREAAGEVIVLCDQDDVWHRDRVEVAVARLGEAGALLVHGDADLVDASGSPLGGSLFDALEVRARELELIESGEAFDVFLRRNLATGATVAFRRELLDLALPFPEEWVHDEWLAVLAAARGGVRVERRPLVDYRQHGGNAIGASAPTLRYKLARLLEPGAERTRMLARRSGLLATRLAETGAPEAAVRAARRKQDFEASRAAQPRWRPGRLPGILRRLRAGDYASFASRGRTDAIRDLLGAPGR